MKLKSFIFCLLIPLTSTMIWWACTGPAPTNESDSFITSGTESMSGMTEMESGVAGYESAGKEATDVIQPTELPIENDPLEGVMITNRPPDQGVRAGWITDSSQVAKGDHLRCRVGCIVMENTIARFCIQGLRNFSQFARNGGNLIDATVHRDPTQDLLAELLISPGLGEVELSTVDILRDGNDGGPAVVQAKGWSTGSRIITSYLPSLAPPRKPVITEYWLYPDRSEIEVKTWVGGEGSINMQIYDLFIWSDLVPLFIEGRRENTSLLELKAISGHGSQLSVEWSRLDGQSSSLTSIPSVPFQPINLGLASGVDDALFLFHRVIRIGDGSLPMINPHASDTEQKRLVKAEVTLSVEDDDIPNTEPRWYAQAFKELYLEIKTQTATAEEFGAEAGIIRLNEIGQGQTRLRSGLYQASVKNWVGGTIEPISFTVENTDLQTPLVLPITLPPPARVTVQVEDTQGSPLGAKVIAYNDSSRQIIPFLGETTLNLPAGTWTLDITRGWHYNAVQLELTLNQGDQQIQRVVLSEEIPISGWTSGEFHQHSMQSLDSEISVQLRVLSNIAEGVGFMVPTDHDVMIDYPNYVQSQGMEQYVGAPITGVEISPSAGHLGAFGIEVNLDTPDAAGGAPPISVPDEQGGFRIRAIPELVDVARSLGAQIIQVNHPRDSTGYFDTVGFDPSTSIEALEHPQWTLDFDTVEVFNGASDFCAVFRDWQALLIQGKRVTGVGNSDTHELRRPAGYPRNYLPHNSISPTQVTSNEIVSALRNGQVSVGGGAYLDLPDGPIWGDTLSGPDHRIRVRIRTPSFSQITRLIALHNGEQVFEKNIESTIEDITDLDEVITLNLAVDGPLIFFAEGPALRYVYPNQPTFAFSNPLWIDVNQDGIIDPLTPLRRPPELTTSFCEE